MNCSEFENRLNTVLDERRQPQTDSHLMDHAGECDDCRTRLAGSRVLLRGLAKLSPPPLAADFARRVVAQARVEAAPRPASRLWFAGGVLLASAATALLAISIVWYARRGGERLAGTSEARSEPRPDLPVGPPRRQRGFAAAQPGKARVKTESFAAGGELLIAAPRLHDHLRGYRGAIDQLAIALPQTAEQLNQMETIAPGIRPLRLSLTAIWDTLCRTIPGAHTDEQSPPRTRTSRWIASGSALA